MEEERKCNFCLKKKNKTLLWKVPSLPQGTEQYLVFSFLNKSLDKLAFFFLDLSSKGAEWEGDFTFLFSIFMNVADILLNKMCYFYI